MLLDCLNDILLTETIPSSWADLKMFLLHKKGDPKVVANYRGISLLNCFAKLFTAIIARRITAWANMNSLLPECQSGFRAGRCCADNLFVLQTAIHEHIRNQGCVVYCTFVDFKAAFDSISHKVLWRKLYAYGLSSKMLNIIANFYRQAQVRVHQGSSTTPAIPISNGVLQGDVLSPLLFSLLLADFESVLEASDVDGVGVGPSLRVSCLFYADDLVLLAYNRSQMQRSLNCLQDYCRSNELIVNTEKTKLVVFSAIKKVPRTPLTLNGSILKVVEEYTYLGVVFSSNGKFSSQVVEAKRKAMIAAASTRQVLGQLSCLSRKSEHSLSEAKICSTMLYGTEFWALWHMDEVEQIQLQYYKRLFLLHFSTPGYVLRHFFGLRPQVLRVLKLALRWFNRVLLMPADRLPRRCLERLASRASDPTYNWVSKVQAMFASFNCQLPDLSRLEVVDLNGPLATVWESFRCADFNRCIASTYCPLYGSFVSSGSTPSLPAVNLREARLLIQVVLQNIRFQSLFWNGAAVTLSPWRTCPCCCSDRPDTLEHFVTECEVFAGLRLALGLPATPSMATLLSFGLETGKLLRFLKEAWRALLLRDATPVG